MTFEERKQAIIANGILSGALIKCASGDGTIGVVMPVDQWREGIVDPRDVVVCESDGAWALFGYDADRNRYATVITPAPAEPSDVERLRERIKELEAERRWIPVSDCLPELHDIGGFGQSEEVLVAFVNQEGEYEQMVDVLQRGGQEDATTAKWCNAYNVTHWMPLPNTPDQQ